MAERSVPEVILLIGISGWGALRITLNCQPYPNLLGHVGKEYGLGE